ncbi:uncharacterized protein FTOL_00143 [Fusarium torulosum]|uniref:Uncharacterized protein n=1 Tax=Fusarium torulosum TaxID=33205 RepID=A0AAE8LXL5_9HYPO|nr:uncharacterized protein FTOL_00143 [Fusarium torulosum]
MQDIPCDSLWPSSTIWRLFDRITGGALIKTVPIAASYYDDYGTYDKSLYSHIVEQWTNSSLHIVDPSSIMWPLYQGRIYQPSTSPEGNYTLGGYPSYVIDMQNITYLQLAINFIRSINLRLVTKNTGHDFNRYSAGAKALLIWIYYFKDIKFFKSYKTKSYNKLALNIRAGIISSELYIITNKDGIIIIIIIIIRGEE